MKGVVATGPGGMPEGLFDQPEDADTMPDQHEGVDVARVGQKTNVNAAVACGSEASASGTIVLSNEQFQMLMTRLRPNNGIVQLQ